MKYAIIYREKGSNKAEICDCLNYEDIPVEVIEKCSNTGNLRLFKINDNSSQLIREWIGSGFINWLQVNMNIMKSNARKLEG